MYFQCKNPHCLNYDPPKGMAKPSAVAPSRARSQLYGRWSDPYVRNNKFTTAGAQARDLVGLEFRTKLNGHEKLRYAIRFTGVFETTPRPSLKAPDMVRLIDVKSDVELIFIDWDGRNWDYGSKSFILPL
jgi:hypothetical protein